MPMTIPIRLRCGCEGDQQGLGDGGYVKIVVFTPCHLHTNETLQVIQAVAEDLIEWRDQKALRRVKDWEAWRDALRTLTEEQREN